MKTLGVIQENEISKELKTGFAQFKSPGGCGGLVKLNGGDVLILAIHSETPGRGQFRKFIRKLKKESRSIGFLSIWNPQLEKILKRYGFENFTHVTSIEGKVELVPGMIWHNA